MYVQCFFTNLNNLNVNSQNFNSPNPICRYKEKETYQNRISSEEHQFILAFDSWDTFVT